LACDSEVVKVMWVLEEAEERIAKWKQEVRNRGERDGESEGERETEKRKGGREERGAERERERERETQSNCSATSVLSGQLPTHRQAPPLPWCGHRERERERRTTAICVSYSMPAHDSEVVQVMWLLEEVEERIA
jgi:hypothetical protein